VAEEHFIAQTGPDRSTDPVIARFPGQRFLWAFVAAGGFATVLFTLGLIQGWLAGDWVMVVFFGCWLALAFPFTFLAARRASTTAFLTRRFVSTPRFWGRRVVSLVEVTGVGLRYVPGQKSFMWRVKVWRNDDNSAWADSSVEVYVPQMERSEPRGVSNRTGFRKRVRPSWDYVPVLDWDYLAQTPQGQAATAIYNQALAVQGPHGPLATQARQRTARSPGALQTAYWSPDGGIGAIRNGQPEAPQ
jgi:hypothetical protein